MDLWGTVSWKIILQYVIAVVSQVFGGGGGCASEAIGNCHHRSSMNMVPALYDSTAHNARRM